MGPSTRYDGATCRRIVKGRQRLLVRLKMEVLRVELEAPVCSFRLPHFLVGRQLTFDMPPPATIYGHIASAVGDFPDPRSFRFAYRFTTIGKGEDLENQHIIVPGGSRPFAIGGVAYPSSTNATVQPTGRQFLFG